MFTPAFVPQSLSSMTPIRYYTPFDPYFYTVDNRPLQDIATNLEALGAVGGDSARRAALLNQLSLSSVFATLFRADAAAPGFADGFEVSLSGGTLQVGPGSLYITEAVNEAISSPIVKQGLSFKTSSFPLTDPSAVLGDAKDYLIQVKLNALNQTSMASSQLPFVDQNNALLPCLLLNGEAVVSIKEGQTAALGSQVTPTVDPGYVPLYVVTYTSSASNHRVKLHASAPTTRRGRFGTQLFANNTLAGTGTTSLTVPVSLEAGRFSPLLPIRVRVLYSVSVPNNAAALRVKYLALGAGSSVTASATLAGQETVAMPASANVLAEFNSSTSSIPTHAFAGFVNGVWQVNKSVLQVTLERAGSDVADTTDGVITVLEVQAFQ